MKTNYQRILTLAVMACLSTSTALFASEMDDRIESSAKESYVFKTYLRDDAVKATSNDGTVTLSGTVNQQSHKALAQATVQSLPGVIDVDNRLELKSGYPAEKSNEWIAMNAKAALLFHRNVSSTNTQVYVEEGILTLRGEVASESEKELTAEYADVEGVRSVRNEMTVSNKPKMEGQTMGEKIDDASITAQVKIALLTHRSTSAVKTSVSTKEGVVTLTGEAQNSAEKDLVTKLVSDIFGVTRIDNNMSIKAPQSN
jgi:hyperosmotically inducible periplasmic protein